MEWFEAVLLGFIQGLTEFLPVSSSGHLEIGKVILGVETTDDLLFTTMVHAATVLRSTFTLLVPLTLIRTNSVLRLAC